MEEAIQDPCHVHHQGISDVIAAILYLDLHHLHRVVVAMHLPSHQYPEGDHYRTHRPDGLRKGVGIGHIHEALTAAKHQNNDLCPIRLDRSLLPAALVGKTETEVAATLVPSHHQEDEARVAGACRAHLLPSVSQDEIAGLDPHCQGEVDQGIVMVISHLRRLEHGEEEIARRLFRAQLHQGETHPLAGQGDIHPFRSGGGEVLVMKLVAMHVEGWKGAEVQAMMGKVGEPELRIICRLAWRGDRYRVVRWRHGIARIKRTCRLNIWCCAVVHIVR